MEEPIYTKEEAKALAYSMNECGVLTSTEPHPDADVPKWLALCIGDMSKGDDRWIVFPQLYACQKGESPRTDRILYHSLCEKCRTVLQLDLGYQPMIVMTHGATHQRYGG